MMLEKALRPISYIGFTHDVLRRVRKDVRDWWMFGLMAIPGELGSVIRLSFINFKGVGRNVRLLRGGWVDHWGNLSIGDHTQINRFFLINAGGGVEIGDNVLIGPYSIIYSQSHNYQARDVLIKKQGYTRAKVVIEDDVWLCARATILPGVRVRKGTVVAAGAIVTKDTEPYSIVAGVPARKIGERE